MHKRKRLTGLAIAAFYLAFLCFACGVNPGGAFLEVDGELCTGCAQCVIVCPVEAVRIVDRKAVIDPGKCTECGRCVEVCPENAVQ